MFRVQDYYSFIYCPTREQPVNIQKQTIFDFIIGYFLY